VFGDHNPAMRIGIDFDNTLVDYDHVFLTAAKQQGLIELDFTGSKQAVRDRIRQSPEGDLAWQRLQGYVYGAGIGEARLFEGVGDFLAASRAHGIDLYVISHKTQFGHHDPLRVDLRRAALGWMEAKGFFSRDGFGIPIDSIFFESTRTEKIARIRAQGCTHFIDDLIEVFADPEFPAEVYPILFAPAGEVHRGALCATWQRIAEVVFDGRA
jgi:hypothetical protein